MDCAIRRRRAAFLVALVYVFLVGLTAEHLSPDDAYFLVHDEVADVFDADGDDACGPDGCATAAPSLACRFMLAQPDCFFLLAEGWSVGCSGHLANRPTGPPLNA